MNRKTTLVSLFILFSLPMLLGLKCNGNSEIGESPTPAVATLSIHIDDDGDLPYPAGGECVRKISWSFMPGTLTGSGGRSTAFDMQDHEYKSKVQTGDCFYLQRVQNLAVGEWTIKAAGADDAYASWRTSCTVTLTPGENNVYFMMKMPGCSTTEYLTP